MNCCATRPNFGHPTCIQDLGVVTSFLFAPMKDQYGNTFGFDINTFTASDFTGALIAVPDARIYPMPQMEAVEIPQADSLFDEAPSGTKSFLRTGKRSFTAETRDKDATSTFAGKLEEVRCNEWGIYLVTDNNKLVGVNKSGTFAPIKIDSQSMDPVFMFKTDSVTQKVMINFDFDRAFKVSEMYAISGDEIWDSVAETTIELDFNNLNQVIDCNIQIGTIAPTTTLLGVKINDDYRQGMRNPNNADLGNVTGLIETDFVLRNLTDDLVVTPTSVTEPWDGYYTFNIPAQTSGDKMELTLVLASANSINYNGSLTYLIP